MIIQQKMFVMFLIFGLILWYPFPTRAYNNRVRIHVPTNVKTVYKTKIVKVPQHHHYFHEKIKEVPKFIPLPNHYDHHTHYNHHDHHEHHHDHHGHHSENHYEHYEPYDKYKYPYDGY